MLEINAQAFMKVVMEVKRTQEVIDHLGDEDSRNKPITEDTRPVIVERVDELISAIEQLYARTTLIAARRLRDSVERDLTFTWKDLRNAEADIESRLRDELGLVKLFVLNDQQSIALQPGHMLVGQQIADRFPSILFEIEEAAKCLVLLRPTACVFHCMRSLEITIRALGSFLGIPDPTKPAEKNWGTILGVIKEKMDSRYPAKTRMPGTEGCQVERLYAFLEAIKNPWRNATMHVENLYQPHEASHILQCLHVFLADLAQLCDEDGQPV